ncbi:hypothetical protein C7N43_31680 [Sphingobacteriales bacterium UPWRP_1]|nr:hypothetical protein BVG80_01505 [Sphingobacteriales bacterium TSM_CSM]PSJ72927.1 hypothetical protein C7N43_31680 [Sphingobacteriales bacterium UPWRP_1]
MKNFAASVNIIAASAATLLFAVSAVYYQNSTFSNILVLSFFLFVTAMYLAFKLTNHIWLQYHLVKVVPFLFLAVAVCNCVFLYNNAVSGSPALENARAYGLYVYALVIGNLFVAGRLSLSNNLKNLYLGGLLLIVLYCSVSLSQIYAHKSGVGGINLGVTFFALLLMLFIGIGLCVIFWSGWFARYWKDLLLPEFIRRIGGKALSDLASTIVKDVEPAAVEDQFMNRINFSDKNYTKKILTAFVPVFLKTKQQSLVVSLVLKLLKNHKHAFVLELLPPDIQQEIISKSDLYMLISIVDYFAPVSTSAGSLADLAMQQMVKLLGANKISISTANLDSEWFFSIIKNAGYPLNFRLNATRILFTIFPVNTLVHDNKVIDFLVDTGIPYFYETNKTVALPIVLYTKQYPVLLCFEQTAEFWTLVQLVKLDCTIIAHIIEQSCPVDGFICPDKSKVPPQLVKQRKLQFALQMLAIESHYKRQPFYSPNVVSLIIEGVSNGSLTDDAQLEPLCSFLLEYFGIENDNTLFSGADFTSGLLKPIKQVDSLSPELLYLSANLCCISPNSSAEKLFKEAWFAYAAKVQFHDELVSEKKHTNNNNYVLAGSLLRAMACCAAANISYRNFDKDKSLLQKLEALDIEENTIRTQVTKFDAVLRQRIVDSFKGITYRPSNTFGTIAAWINWVQATHKWIETELTTRGFSDEIYQLIEKECAKNINIFMPTFDKATIDTRLSFLNWLNSNIEEVHLRFEQLEEKIKELSLELSAGNLLLRVVANEVNNPAYIRQHALAGLQTLLGSSSLDSASKDHISSTIAKSAERMSQSERDHFYEVRLYSGSSIGELCYFIRLALNGVNSDLQPATSPNLADALLKFESEFNDLISFLERYPLQITAISPTHTTILGYYLETGYNPMWWTRYIPNSAHSAFAGAHGHHLGEVKARYIEISNLTEPNAMGIANICFTHPLLLLPTIFHEYQHYKGEKREVAVWVMEHLFTRHIIAKYAPENKVDRKKYWADVLQAFFNVSTRQISAKNPILLYAVLGLAGQLLLLSDSDLFDRITEVVGLFYKPPVPKGSPIIRLKLDEAINKINVLSMICNSSKEVISWYPNIPFPKLNQQQEKELGQIIEDKCAIDNFIDRKTFTSLISKEPYATWRKEWQNFIASV